MSGGRIVASSWAGTVLLAATAVPALVAPRLDPAAVAVAVALFAAGSGAFLWALARAAARSRTAAIGMGGLFFLQGSAPRPVRRHLLGSLLLQVAIGLGTAIARPFTPAAFGVLVPIYGLALCGLWAARYGTFGPRVAEPRRR